MYGAPTIGSVSEEQVIQAAKEANAWSFIQQCPQGLDTIVGERGVLHSGGNLLIISYLWWAKLLSIILPTYSLFLLKC